MPAILPTPARTEAVLIAAMHSAVQYDPALERPLQIDACTAIVANYYRRDLRDQDAWLDNSTETRAALRRLVRAGRARFIPSKGWAPALTPLTLTERLSLRLRGAA